MPYPATIRTSIYLNFGRSSYHESSRYPYLPVESAEEPDLQRDIPAANHLDAEDWRLLVGLKSMPEPRYKQTICLPGHTNVL